MMKPTLTLNTMNATLTLLTALLLAPLAAHAQHAVVAARPEPAGSNRIVLVERGKPRAVVVTADTPTAMAAYAVEELLWHVKKATGVELPTARESEPAAVLGAWSHRIYVGVTEAARKQGIDPIKLGPETALLRSVGVDLYVFGREAADAAPLDYKLVGDTPWTGTLNGVYELLERVAGVRWLWSGELGTFVPRTDTLALKPIDEVIAPATRYRVLHLPTETGGAKLKADRDLMVFLRRHRANGSGFWPAGHSFKDWWNEYGKEHPEWFALDEKGVRGGYFKKGVGSPMCVSSPDFQRFVVEKWGTNDWPHLSEVDVKEYCRCPDCMAMDSLKAAAYYPAFTHPDYTNQGQARVISDRYARFWKQLYEQAAERNPDVKISAYCYLQTFHAPLDNIQLSENIYGEFAPWGMPSGFMPLPSDVLGDVKAQWLGWKRTGMTLGYRPNTLCGGYVLPFLSTRQVGDFIKFTFDHDSIGCRNGVSTWQRWESAGPMIYLSMRLTHDPRLSVEQVRAEYFSAFGPAAADVERYFDYWEAFSHRLVETVWPRQIGGIPHWSMMKHLGLLAGIYTDDTFAEAGRILDEALAKARSHQLPEFAERVAFLQVGLEHARLTMRFLRTLDTDPNSVWKLRLDPQRLMAARACWKDLEAFWQTQGHQIALLNHYTALLKRSIAGLDTLK